LNINTTACFSAKNVVTYVKSLLKKEINMPIIRPLSDLRTNTNEVLKTFLQEEQPVFLTKNGHGRLVVMSQSYFERMQAMTRLYAKLDEAEKSAEAGDKGISHKEMMRRVRARLKRKIQ
jgi:prevent-host-death family protein